MSVLSDSMLLRKTIEPLEFVSSSRVRAFGNPTVDKPSGVEEGMLLVAFWFCTNQTTLPTFSGWTLRYDGTGTADTGVAIFTKIAGSSEPASYSFSGGTTTNTDAHILAYRKGAGLVDVVGVKQQASSTISTAPSITPTRVGALISGFSIEVGNRTVSSAPAGMSECSSNPTGGTGISSFIFHQLPNPPGATGVRQLTWSGSSSITAGVSLQIY